VRVTVAVAKVLATLLAAPGEPRYGLDLMAATGLPSGTLYPILHRLREAGWVGAEWEPIDPVAEGRPLRRYYELTAEGVERARVALAEVHAATAAVSPPRVTGPSRSPRPRSAW
jgi:PadR family transcriptional regulator